MPISITITVKVQYYANSDRLGLEPILFVCVNLTVTVMKMGTETVRVYGPLTQTQNIRFVLISAQSIDIMLTFKTKHAEREMPTRSVNGPIVLGLIPVSRLNRTTQRFTRSPCPERLPNKYKSHCEEKSPKHLCVERINKSSVGGLVVVSGGD